jgi:MFS family permease
MRNRLSTLFPAFKYRNYRIYFGSQIVSLIGTWMQTVAQGYLVYQMTGSAFWVGAIASLGYLPSTVFSLIGGTLVDRFPKRNVLQITQFLSFILATFLGVLVITNSVTLISLGILAFLMGLVNAVDQPARFAVVVELVDREHLHSATALNMGTFNSARIVGPALAGWLIFWFGAGWAFLINGLSFLAPFLAYQFIKFQPFIPMPRQGTLAAIKEGVGYAYQHPRIKYLLLYLGAISIFGWSYVSILPVIAKEVFNQDAQGLGLFYSAAGTGSVLGAILMSAVARNYKSSRLILLGGATFSISLIIFSLTSNYPLALVILFFGGLGMTTQNATTQTTIQRLVDDKYRGRVLSIQSLMLMGLHPVGAFEAGLVAQSFGSQVAIRFGGAALLLCGILLFLKRPQTKT